MSESRAPRVVCADLLGENRSAPSAATARTNSADHRTSASENHASDQEPTLGSPVNAQHFRIQVSTFQTQSLACSAPSDRDQKRRRRRQISRKTQALQRISEEVGSEGVRRSISSSHSLCWATTAQLGQASSPTFTVLHGFNGKDGTSLGSPVVQASNRNFYGTTLQAGDCGSSCAVHFCNTLPCGS